MSVGEALRDLSRVLDEYEADGTVTSLGLTGRADPDGSGSLTAEVELELATLSSVEESGSAIRNGDGGRTLPVALDSTAPPVPDADRDIDVEVTDSTLATDGTITLAFTTAVTDDGDRPSGGAAGDDAGNSLYDRDVPPFEDPELLADVYERCDTFAEMAGELGMDVTAETVRRYMIDHDIHEPNSYDTGQSGGGTDRTVPEDAGQVRDGDDEIQVVLADGIGLPEDVTADALVETVRRSNTLFEVKQDLGLDRERALRLLRELDLLDLVMGRLAEADRDIGREEIIRRLRAASAAS